MKEVILFLLIIECLVFTISADENEKPPNLTQLPTDLSFSCDGKKPGFYADPEMECQVYHICSPENDHSAFLCGPGTIFNQKTLVCDLPFNYNCKDAPNDAEEANAHAFEKQDSSTEA